jgi:hypothetical protein
MMMVCSKLFLLAFGQHSREEQLIFSLIQEDNTLSELQQMGLSLTILFLLSLSDDVHLPYI